jgi:hypothetical protein
MMYAEKGMKQLNPAYDIPVIETDVQRYAVKLSRARLVMMWSKEIL